MTAAEKYDTWEPILHRRLINWGRVKRAEDAPGLGYPKESVYCKEYQPPVGGVWDDRPIGDIDGDADVMDYYMQALNTYDRYLYCALWVRYYGNAFGDMRGREQMETAATRFLGRVVTYRNLREWEREAKTWLFQNGVMV